MTDETPLSDGTSGDFLTVLSSELIAEVMEDYFNKKMYRQKVKVVDLQPQGSGYAFSLAFVKDDPKLLYTTPVAADNNGSFIRTQKYEVCVHGIPRDNTCYTCLTENRLRQRDQSILDSMAKEALESATTVDYTVPTTPNGRDTKGKFAKAKKDKVT
jgi:hypothetical protein